MPCNNILIICDLIIDNYVIGMIEGYRIPADRVQIFTVNTRKCILSNATIPVLRKRSVDLFECLKL